jgi:predicted ribosome quality control (RQC) complex YloA/Tae2 family protein
MQSVDFTTLRAAIAELCRAWLPAKVEQVYQTDPHTLALSLRTLNQRGWLNLSWHPQAARICLGDAPPRTPDTFTLSEQLRHQLNGYALIGLETLTPWERVVDCQFAKRPQDPPVWHIYLEIMGKYSNLILTDAKRQIVTVGHQVNSSQSTVRTVQTGQPYEPPPALLGDNPSLEESLSAWQEKVGLIPGSLERQLIKTYRGVSPILARFLLTEAEIAPEATTQALTPAQWQALFWQWQRWLKCLEAEEFSPTWTPKGYWVFGGDNSTSLNSILNRYYRDCLQKEIFKQLHNQLSQKVKNNLEKLGQKVTIFQNRIAQAEQAEEYKQKADLLMAYLHEWQPGMKEITLQDFTTLEPVTIPLNPEKTNIQNAQNLYKQHQKLKRTRVAIEPLLQEVITERQYLEQVEESLNQLETYSNPEDLETLAEIQEELRQEQYLSPQHPRPVSRESQPHRHLSPSGFEIWVGRNNRQNDQLTFRSANDYDLWFHSQEIPGSHVLLRLTPGAVAADADLQACADVAAYYSQARLSQQVPVVYTQPKHLYKPKGAKPGMVVYKHEQVIWGSPQRAERLREKK